MGENQREEGFSVSLDRKTLPDTQSSYDIQPALSDLNILPLGNKRYTSPSTLPRQNVYAPQKRQNVLTYDVKILTNMGHLLARANLNAVHLFFKHTIVQTQRKRAHKTEIRQERWNIKKAEKL